MVSNVNDGNFATLQTSVTTDVSVFDSAFSSDFAIKFGDPKDHLSVNMLALCHGFLLGNFAQYSLMSVRTYHGVLVGFAISVTVNITVLRQANAFSHLCVTAFVCSMALVVFAALEGKFRRLFSLRKSKPGQAADNVSQTVPDHSTAVFYA
jgi:hypothetical protein